MYQQKWFNENSILEEEINYSNLFHISDNLDERMNELLLGTNSSRLIKYFL